MKEVNTHALSNERYVKSPKPRNNLAKENTTKAAKPFPNLKDPNLEIEHHNKTLQTKFGTLKLHCSVSNENKIPSVSGTLKAPSPVTSNAQKLSKTPVANGNGSGNSSKPKDKDKLGPHETKAKPRQLNMNNDLFIWIEPRYIQRRHTVGSSSKRRPKTRESRPLESKAQKLALHDAVTKRIDTLGGKDVSSVTLSSEPTLIKTNLASNTSTSLDTPLSSEAEDLSFPLLSCVPHAVTPPLKSAMKSNSSPKRRNRSVSFDERLSSR